MSSHCARSGCLELALRCNPGTRGPWCTAHNKHGPLTPGTQKPARRCGLPEHVWMNNAAVNATELIPPQRGTWALKCSLTGLIDMRELSESRAQLRHDEVNLTVQSLHPPATTNYRLARSERTRRTIPQTATMSV